MSADCLNFTELECDECGDDDNDCVLCRTCDQLLCRSCTNRHERRHKLIDPQNPEDK